MRWFICSSSGCDGRYFPKRREFTVDEIIEDAVARAREHHELTYPGKRFRPYRYWVIGEWFKGCAAGSLTPQDIAAKLAEHCKTPANYNRYRVALSHAFKLAVESKKAVENPTKSVKMKKENNGCIRWLGQYAPLPTDVGYLKPPARRGIEAASGHPKRFPRPRARTRSRAQHGHAL